MTNWSKKPEKLGSEAQRVAEIPNRRFQIPMSHRHLILRNRIRIHRRRCATVDATYDPIAVTTAYSSGVPSSGANVVTASGSTEATRPVVTTHDPIAVTTSYTSGVSSTGTNMVTANGSTGATGAVVTTHDPTTGYIADGTILVTTNTPPVETTNATVASVADTNVWMTGFTSNASTVVTIEYIIEFPTARTDVMSETTAHLSPKSISPCNSLFRKYPNVFVRFLITGTNICKFNSQLKVSH